MGVKICPDCGGKVSETRMDCPHCGYCFTKTAEKIQCPECEEWVIKNEKGECPECGYCFGEEASSTFPSFTDSVPDLGLDDASIDAAINQSNNILKMEPIPGMMKYKVTRCVNEYVTEIVIPDTVYVIGKGAFYGLRYLCKVTFSDSVRVIEDEAFAACPMLEITLPEGVDCGRDVIRGTKTDNDRIDEAWKAEEADRKASEEAERKAKEEFKTTFAYVETRDGIAIMITSLKKKDAKHIVIPNFVTTIGDRAFEDCSSLTSVRILDGLKGIYDNAFHNCSNLISVTIPNSVTWIGSGTFADCSSLTLITISGSVTSIGNYAFYSCSSLTSITIPSSVTSIGNYAFYSCSSLTSITIPSSVTSIDFDAFNGCSRLTSIRYTGTKSQWGKILKGSCWDQGCGYYAIHCSDGDI